VHAWSEALPQSAQSIFRRSGYRFVADNAAQSETYRASRLQRDREVLQPQGAPPSTQKRAQFGWLSATGPGCPPLRWGIGANYAPFVDPWYTPDISVRSQLTAAAKTYGTPLLRSSTSERLNDALARQGQRGYRLRLPGRQGLRVRHLLVHVGVHEVDQPADRRHARAGARCATDN